MNRKKLKVFYSLLLSLSIILNTIGYSFANEPINSNTLNVGTLQNNNISLNTDKNNLHKESEDTKR